MKLHYSSIISLLTLFLEDLLVYYSISSARWNDDLYQEGGLRIELKDLNKHIPGRANYKKQRRRSVFVRPSSKTRGKSPEI